MFKVCIDDPFPNCEKIFPIQQKRVAALIRSLDFENVVSVMIFGSSVNARCHVGSDVDVYMELRENKYPIMDALPFAYDLWTNFTVDEHLMKEIKSKGVKVYG